MIARCVYIKTDQYMKIRNATSLIIVLMDSRLQIPFYIMFVMFGDAAWKMTSQVDIESTITGNVPDIHISIRILINKHILFGIYDSNEDCYGAVRIPHSEMVSSILRYSDEDVMDMNNEAMDIVETMKMTYTQLHVHGTTKLQTTYMCIDSGGSAYSDLYVLENGGDVFRSTLKNGIFYTKYTSKIEPDIVDDVHQLFIKLYDQKVCPPWAVKIGRSHTAWSGT